MWKYYDTHCEHDMNKRGAGPGSQAHTRENAMKCDNYVKVPTDMIFMFTPCRHQGLGLSPGPKTVKIIRN